ncbi:ABC transporter ATP-binding protein [Leucobacter sp. OH1287]|uniref:ABC transporter ATP-binding protein n=1 Tax=Leucobacter sp. OH1287 TaxID=2491049 RepID=UPI000F5DB422|nr:ATP-binding cassette domain-containing protein [Leucobacter sp. OH1287]RRD60968.1 ABC transporter ATP-binding protein [Leucobacter sp. OH1287]
MTNDKIAAFGTPQPRDLLRITDCSVYTRDRAGRKQTRLVKNVSFQVSPGECLAIVGNSGAGKSLLVKASLGILPTELLAEFGESSSIAGELLPGSAAGSSAAGTTTAAKTTKTARLSSGGGARRSEQQQRRWARIRRNHIGYINQDALSAMDPLQRVAPQVAEVLRLQKLSRAQIPERVNNALTGAQLEPTRQLLRSYPHELSGGMRQRALIAGAAASEPELLVADEPTTALDPDTGERVLNVLRSYVDRGAGMILISHDLNAVAQIADRVIVMSDGEIVESGKTAAVLAGPTHPVTRALVDSLQLLTGDGEASGSTSDHTVRNTDCVLRVTDLTVGYRHKPVLTGVNLSLHRGEVLGLVGPSGAGKTTLTAALTGGARVFAGEFTEGLKYGVVPQNAKASMLQRMRVRQVLREVQRGGRGSTSEQALSEIAASVGLGPEVLQQRIRQLSGGQAQRVAIARAILSRPDVLILDEPVAALDASLRWQIVELLQQLKAETGIPMLIISHELASLNAIADRVLRVADGRVGYNT